MNRVFGVMCGGLALVVSGCGASRDAGDGALLASDVPITCEGPQPPRVQDVRWLGTVVADKVPLGGVAAEVGKSVTLTDGVEITTKQVEYTPVAADQNMALALVVVRRGNDTKQVRLARRLPGGPVCYQEAAGLWVGLVETVPNKAMVRVGMPPPAPPPEK